MPSSLYHGTSTDKLDEIQDGSERLSDRTYPNEHRSLGGAYLTNLPSNAHHYSEQAARVHGGGEVILEVKPNPPLTPDEDWVRSVTRYHHNHEPFASFLDDLYERNDGSEPLEITYRRHFRELNETHGITWRESLDVSGNLRQASPLVEDQILDVRQID
jgi:hypothetical protein